MDIKAKRQAELDAALANLKRVVDAASGKGPLLTTNYDELIRKAFHSDPILESVTPQEWIAFTERHGVRSATLRVADQPPQPGELALRAICWMGCSSEKRELVFSPLVADMQAEIEAAGDAGKFRGIWWLRLRGYGALTRAASREALSYVWKTSLSEAGKMLLKAGLVTLGSYLLEKVAEAWKLLK